MSAKGMLGAMAVGTVAVLLLGARWSEPARHVPVRATPHETPWLTAEAAAQIIGPRGTLGPLFAGAELGAPVPPAVRARVAAFARAHHVAIDLEVAQGTLSAIRFEVAYSGCCGYEGADVLALRLGRPHTGHCCVCGQDTWIDDWALAEDGMQVRARVRVNRVVVRWERTWSAAELVERADELVGQSAAAVRDAAGDRWSYVAPGAVLEVPFVFAASAAGGDRVIWMSGDARGLHLLIERGTITQVSFVPGGDDSDRAGLRAALRRRWGRPRVTNGDRWTWRKRDRTITAQMDAYWPTLTIRAAGATSTTR